MSDLPSREAIVHIRDTDRHAASILIAQLMSAYVDGRLVDRDAFDYEAMRQVFDDNYLNVGGGVGVFMDLLHSMIAAAIGDGDD